MCVCVCVTSGKMELSAIEMEDTVRLEARKSGFEFGESVRHPHEDTE